MCWRGQAYDTVVFCCLKNKRPRCPGATARYVHDYLYTRCIFSNSFHIVVCSILTGGCSEGLGAFRFFFKRSGTPHAMYYRILNTMIGWFAGALHMLGERQIWIGHRILFFKSLTNRRSVESSSTRVSREQTSRARGRSVRNCLRYCSIEYSSVGEPLIPRPLVSKNARQATRNLNVCVTQPDGIDA